MQSKKNQLFQQTLNICNRALIVNAMASDTSDGPVGMFNSIDKEVLKTQGQIRTVKAAALGQLKKERAGDLQMHLAEAVSKKNPMDNFQIDYFPVVSEDEKVYY